VIKLATAGCDGDCLTGAEFGLIPRTSGAHGPSSQETLDSDHAGDRYQWGRLVTVKMIATTVTVLLALVGIGMGTPLPAGAAATDDSGDSVTMTVAPDTLGIPADNAELPLTVTIANDSSAAIDAGLIDVVVNRTPLDEPEVLTGWLTNAVDSITAPTSVDQSESGAIAAGETRIFSLGITPEELGFTEEGVYALGVQLTVGDSVESIDAANPVAAAHTAVSWQSTSENPLRVAVVAPLALPASATGLLDAATLTQYTDVDGILTAQLDAMIGRPVLIGIDPRIIASIRLLGDSAPQSVLEWLDRLSTVPNATFPLAWADADLTAALQAGAATPLTPTSFDFAINPDLFDTATAAPTGAPLPGGEPDPENVSPPLPTSTDLTQWNYTYPNLSWPAADSVTAADLAILDAAGANPTLLSSDNATVAAPASSSSAASTATASGVLASVGDSTVAVADSRLSTLLQDAVTAETTAAWNSAMAELSATVAIDSIGNGETPPLAVATLGRSWPSEEFRLEQTLAELYGLPWATSANMSTVFDSGLAGDSSLPSAEIVDAAPDDTHLDTVRGLLEAEAAEDRFAMVVADPLALTADRRLSLLSLLSNAWQGDDEGWSTAAAAYLDESEVIRSSVQILPSSVYQVGSDSADLPFTVKNDLAQTVTVYINVRASNIGLTVDQSAVELVIEPESSRRALFPVEGLSNGKVMLTVSITDRMGQPVGTPTQVELNVHAGWETAGTLGFGAVVLVIFGAGIVRTIRKRRKASRTPA